MFCSLALSSAEMPAKYTLLLSSLAATARPEAAENSWKAVSVKVSVKVIELISAVANSSKSSANIKCVMLSFSHLGW